MTQAHARRICLWLLLCLSLPCAKAQRVVGSYQQTVQKAPSVVALSANSTSVTVGTPLGLTATATGSQGVLSSGTIIFTATDSASNITTATVPIQPDGTAGWQATLPTSVYTITASFGGNSDYSPSLSSPLQATVASSTSAGPPADFTLIITAATGAVRQGGTFSSAVQITSLNGFSGDVVLSCGTLPDTTGCTFANQSVHVVPGAPASTTVAITTMATTVNTLAGLGGFLSLLGVTRRSRRAIIIRKYLLVATALLSIAALVGCGALRYQQTNGTPKGTYAIQITATSRQISHQGTLTITVQ